MSDGGTVSTKTLDREALLVLCERGFVPQDRWRNRDSSSAQQQLGEAYALLRAGCEFYIRTDGDMHWVAIEYKGFDYFNGMGPLDHERYYVPTAERLDRTDGRDWY